MWRGWGDDDIAEERMVLKKVKLGDAGMEGEGCQRKERDSLEGRDVSVAIWH